MDKITEISDKMPHIAIPDLEGNMHVVPESLFRDIVNGSQEIERLDDWRQIIRAIVRDWLRSLKD